MHRTSVTQGFLAKIIFVYFGRLHKVFSVNVPIAYGNSLFTQKKCFWVFVHCSHLGRHSSEGEVEWLGH